MTTITSLSKMLSETASLPVFSPAYGHTYLPPASKPATASQIGLLQKIKEPTPMPGSQSATSGQNNQNEARPSAATDTQTLINAIRMTMRYGKEYMDESPLVGEPGNFRLSKQKQTLVSPTGADLPTARLTSPPKDKSATPAQRPASPPMIQTDIPPVDSKKSAKASDRSPTTPGGSLKPKRRKSKIASMSEL